ncbi:hypothetical protein GCM10023334_042690 [Nonomuraea thailandensis]
MAPPKTKANIAVNRMGWNATSKNCSGFLRIFFSARHAMVSVWPTVSPMETRRRAAATRSAAWTASRAGAIVVVIGSPPYRFRRHRRSHDR